MITKYTTAILTGLSMSLFMAITSCIAQEVIIKDFDISYDPEGNTRLYYSYRDDANPDIYINQRQKDEQNLTKSPDRWDIEPDYSPDGKKIIYSSGPNMAKMELRMMNGDGSDDKLFFNGPTSEIGASWSPDGTRIVFSTYDSETKAGDIFVINSDGSGLKNLTENSDGVSNGPSWSKDGNNIVFVHSPTIGGQQDIYQMNLNGGNIKRLTNTSNSKMGPIFTPNGDVIVYSGSDGDFNNLYAISADNPKIHDKARQLTNTHDKHEYFVNFTPNNVHMIYSAGDWSNGFKMEHQSIPRAK